MTHDLFEGFESRSYDTSGGRLHAWVGGPIGGDAILLLHGFPQSAVSWHPVAPALAEDHRVVCLDLKGYGGSDAPRGDNGRHAYAKRTMADEAVQVMAAEGYRTFTVVGHDRGALVAYCMALHHPDRVARLGILDNLPIFEVWNLIDADPEALPHWRSLVRAGHEAESEITEAFMLDILRVHKGDGTLDGFDPEAIASYKRDWSEAARRHAYAEDYRAGAAADRDADQADFEAGLVVTCPTLIVWGEIFLGRLGQSPLEIWRRSFAPDAIGIELSCGHFLLEEAPGETLAAMRQLMTL